MRTTEVHFIIHFNVKSTLRRLQAREDAAKRKDESMLLSTKKIIDSTDDVLRSAKTLLKSTEYKDGNEDSSNREYPAISSKKYPASKYTY